MNQSIFKKKVIKNKKTPMNLQVTESEIDDDDFELKMTSTMKIIKRQKVDTIE